MKTKYFGGLLLLLALLTLAACDSTDPADDVMDDDGFDISLYEGTYTGTVSSNPSFADPTPVDVTITQESDQTATLTTDFGPTEEGGDDPEPIVLDGTYDDEGATFTGEQDGADYEILIGAEGDVTGQQVVIFAGEPLTLDIEGTITESDLNLDLNGELPEGTDLPLPPGTPVALELSAQKQ